MNKMMPKMMGMMGGGEDKCGMMEMMSKEMMGGKEMEMPSMMMEMMPQCLRIMLPSMSKEKRIDFVLKMVTTLMEQGCVGMSEEEKKGFVARVVEKVKT